MDLVMPSDVAKYAPTRKVSVFTSSVPESALVPKHEKLFALEPITTMRNVDVKSDKSVLFKFLYERHFKSPKNSIIVVVGETGSGKSMLGVSLLYKLNPEAFIGRDAIDVMRERIAFTPEGFMELLDKHDFKRGDVVIYDEPQVFMNSRDFMSQTNRLINKILTTYRYKQLITVFCTPSLSFIDAQARKLVTMFIHPHQMNVGEGYVVAKVYKMRYNPIMDVWFPMRIRFIDERDKTVKQLGAVRFYMLPNDVHAAYKEHSLAFKENVKKTVTEKLNSMVESQVSANIKMTPLEKEVFLGRIEQHLTHEQIAQKTGFPEHMIRKTIREMRKKGFQMSKAWLPVVKSVKVETWGTAFHERDY